MLAIENLVRRIFRTGAREDDSGAMSVPWSPGQRLRARDHVRYQYRLSGGWLEPGQEIVFLDVSGESGEVGFSMPGGARDARATFDIWDCEKFEPVSRFRI